MPKPKRTVYQLVVGDQKIINTHLNMEEVYWKPILMSTFPSPTTTPYGTLFAVIMERVNPEDRDK
jgi:hypothetical protein